MTTIVGTSHSYQMTNICTPAGSEMLSYLSALCLQNQIAAIGEEISTDALNEYEISESVSMNVAKKLNLQHCLCDPTRAERYQLNIQQDNDVRAQAFQNNWSEKETDLRIQAEYTRREKYWLNKLQALNKWPLLFICGANHTTSFANLLKSHGIEVVIASNDWKPAESNGINKSI